jgi:hypothetical protein
VRQLIIGIPCGPDEDVATDRLVSALADATAGENRTVVVARPGAPAGAGEGPPRTGTGAIDVQYSLRPQDALEVPYHGLTGRARAIHAILTRARGADAACLIVDTRATEATGWIDAFVRALAEDEADFVGPVYGRHPFSSGLIHGILAPLFAALYGHRLQYPVGLHFACSARLIAAVLEDPVWDRAAAQPAIEWSLATAAAANFRMAEAPVTTSTREDRPILGLSTTTAQLLGVVFADIERQARVWQRIRGSKPVIRVGANAQHEPAPPIDAAALAESFRTAYRDLHGVWEEMLPPLSIMQWRRLTTVTQDAFRIPDTVWARTLYDFAMGHRLRVIPRADLLRSLTPLYLAWLASFVLETQGAPAEAIGARLARVRTAFEQEKRYLVSQWRWPERFRPVKLRR